MNTAEIQHLLVQINTHLEHLQKSVLDVNEQNILQCPKDDQPELFAAHDAIINFINIQQQAISKLAFNLNKSYSKKYVDDLKDTIAKQRKYIEVLGGNPSIINHIKMEDLNAS